MKASELKVPPDLYKALKSTPSVEALWNDLTPIAQRDFVTWIEGAKLPATRIRRIGIARDKLIRGDRRPCCYAVVPMNLYKALGANVKAKSVWKDLTPMAKRDFANFIDEAKDSNARELRIEKIISMLAHGKKSPGR